MARVPRFGGEGDFLDRSRKQQEHVRQLRSQKRCHAESKTFIIPGDITDALYVPEFWVAINTDGNNPEFKTIYALRGVLAAGTVTVQWLINGVQVGADHAVTTTPNEFEVLVDPDDFPAANLSDGDTIRPAFLDSTGASDFSGSVAMMTTAA